MTETASPHNVNQLPSSELFKGKPTEIRPLTLDVPVDAELWRPGVLGSNGGLVAAHDRERPVAHLAHQDDSSLFATRGYAHGEANVPLTGGDQSAWFGQPLYYEKRSLDRNHTARSRGVKGRTIEAQNGQYERFTTDPFDEGEFVDMQHAVEIDPLGRSVKNPHGTQKEDATLTESVGQYNNNNGTLAWVTPDGKSQIAPASDQRVARLRELGYETGEINVPHSNGERFDTQSGSSQDHAQTWANLELQGMKSRGETMSMDERNSRFGRVAVPVEHLDLIRN
ncbi:MAG: hypothetical protein M3Q79_01695 [bacterium]|nr:hypothetical protein [bacterium]